MSSINKHIRNVEKASRPIAAQFGVEVIGTERAKNHNKLILNKDGLRRKVIYSSSPSCDRAIKNHLSVLKKVCSCL